MSEWISVEERRVIPDGLIIVATNAGDVFPVDSKELRLQHTQGYYTHWMPLPEPPEGEQE